jgi:DNA-directed RNA polymerase specialized sigma24 family protein
MFSIDVEIEPGLSLKDVLKDLSDDAFEFLSNQDKRKTLQECVHLLEADEQYFIELFLNQGLSLEQIREYFKINRGAVDMRKSRIFQKLQDCFKNKGFFKLDFSG